MLKCVSPSSATRARVEVPRPCRARRRPYRRREPRAPDGREGPPSPRASCAPRGRRHAPRPGAADPRMDRAPHCRSSRDTEDRRSSRANSCRAGRPPHQSSRADPVPAESGHTLQRCGRCAADAVDRHDASTLACLEYRGRNVDDMRREFRRGSMRPSCMDRLDEIMEPDATGIARYLPRRRGHPPSHPDCV